MSEPRTSISGTPYLADPDFTLYNGDALEVLKTLPDESVHCCVTSPPYWGLRDYGAEGQLGLEPTPDAYVAKMVEVFREVRRVLRKDGTCWLNIGDSYAIGGGAGTQGANGQMADRGVVASRIKRPRGGLQGGTATVDVSLGGGRAPGLKPKDLCMIPARLALALQADGWYLRSQIVWAKPNPMPESVTDRPTTAHEFVYLLTKSKTYFYDAEAVREDAIYGRKGWADAAGTMRRAGGDPERSKNGNATWKGCDPSAGRNLRSVWEIATEPFPEAHFATYPQELVRRCILAGCPEGGTILDPFLGSGTTALVARKHGRKCIGIELSADYCELAAKRTAQLSLEAEAV